MTEPQRVALAAELSDNREQIARLCGEVINDIRAKKPEGELMVNINFLERLIQRRRRIKYYRGGNDRVD